jgi:hypothetical protein
MSNLYLVAFELEAAIAEQGMQPEAFRGMMLDASSFRKGQSKTR